MKSPLVSIIIPTHDHSDLLCDCLQSVCAQTYMPYEVIVVDNASTDDTPAMLKRDFPTVRVITNQENRFFAGAVNQGINASQGEYVLVLNNDVTLDKDYIRHLVAIFDRFPLVGMASGKIASHDGACLDSTGLFLSYTAKPRDRGYGEPDRGQYDTPGFIFGASGSAGLYRKELLEAITVEEEYFDAAFGYFYEDLDLTWRARKKGWQAYYEPRSCAWHYRGATTTVPSEGVASFSHRRWLFRHLKDEGKVRFISNRYRFLWKNRSCVAFLLHLPGILLYDIALWGYLLLFERRLMPLIVVAVRRLCTQDRIPCVSTETSAVSTQSFFSEKR